MNCFQTIVIALLKNALLPGGDQTTIPDDFDGQAVLELGREHQILPLLYYGVENLRIKISEGVLTQMKQSVLINAVIDEKQRYEVAEITRAFDINRIDYVLLKGIVVKPLYPHAEMRPMGDADILIRKSQYGRIRPVMQMLGFHELKETDHEYIWNKGDALHLELHKQLISSQNEDFCAYFGDGWKLAKPQQGNPYCYVMDDEDVYVYMFTHFAKHYRASGIGIRHLVDLWVYLCAKPKMNQERIHHALQELGLDVFYANVIRVIEVWFDGKTPDEVTDCITNKIFCSGSFGVQAMEVVFSAIRQSESVKSFKNARRKRLRQVLFPTWGKMCLKYKYLEKIPILLPVMWVFRIITAFTFRHGAVKMEREKLKILSVEVLDDYQNELKFVGLGFAFEKRLK